jgi:uncharacterized protein YdbL (DUF1318 family)
MTRLMSCVVGLVLAAVVPLGLAPVAAQSSPLVASARASGMVGERIDGYLGYASPPSRSLRAQVDAINIRRRALYISLARRRSVSAQEVGIAAACELLRRVAVGEAYMLADGVWRRRAAGQPVQRPDYCG